METADRDALGYTSEERAAINGFLKAGRTSEKILRNVDETLQTAMIGAEILAETRYYFDGPITFTNLPEDAEIPIDPGLPTAEMVRAMGYGLVQAHRRGIRIAITFGVATTHALQNLRSTELGFDDWWQPRSAALRADSLGRYFYLLRSVLLKEGYLRATTAVTEYASSEGRNWIDVETYFHEPPTTKDEQDITGRTALDLIEMYLADLGLIVAEAWAYFCPSVDSTARTTPIVSGQARVERQDP